MDAKLQLAPIVKLVQISIAEDETNGRQSIVSIKIQEKE